MGRSRLHTTEYPLTPPIANDAGEATAACTGLPVIMSSSTTALSSQVSIDEVSLKIYKSYVVNESKL